MKDADFRRRKYRPYSVALGTLAGIGVATWIILPHVEVWSTRTLALSGSFFIALGMMLGYFVVELIYGAPPSDASEHDKANYGNSNSYGRISSFSGDPWNSP